MIGELDDATDKGKNLNLLINADERLQLAYRSMIEFKHSMSSTNLNMDGVEITLSSIEESMFNEMTRYVLSSTKTSHFTVLQSSVHELLENLPEEYDAHAKEEFIDVINNIK